MDKKNIQAIIDRARAKATVQKEESQTQAEVNARVAAEARRKAIMDRVNRFLTEHLEGAVTRTIVAEQSKVLLFEGDDTDDDGVFAEALCAELRGAGYRATVVPRNEPSGKMGYGRGDDFVTVPCVYIDL